MTELLYAVFTRTYKAELDRHVWTELYTGDMTQQLREALSKSLDEMGVTYTIGKVVGL